MVKRGADVGGDQQLLLAKVRLHLKETEKLKKDGTNLRFNIIKLKVKVKLLPPSMLKNRFQVLGDIGKGIDEHPC